MRLAVASSAMREAATGRPDLFDMGFLRDYTCAEDSRIYTFGTKADADQSSGDAAQEWPAFQELHRPGKWDLFIRAKNASNQSILNEHLHALCDSCWQFTSPLNSSKI